MAIRHYKGWRSDLRVVLLGGASDQLELDQARERLLRLLKGK